MDFFDQITKNVIGANQFADLQRRLAFNSKHTFPFYNIRKDGENNYKIELALCGYNIGDLDITVEKNILTISSTGVESGGDEYIFRGFAARKFMKQFTLMENIVVRTADLTGGILSVWLEALVKDDDKPKKINITSPSAQQHPQLLNEDSVF